MARKRSEYRRGQNPNSLANLHQKKGDRHNHTILVSDEAWDGAKALAEELGLDGVADLVEKLGKKELKVEKEN